MTNKLVVAFACFGLAASAGAEVNFDKGVDVKGVVAQVEETVNKDLHTQPGPHYSRFTRECRSFSFGPSAYPLSSDRGGEYAGEQVAITVELIKDGFLFFNSSKGEKTFTFDAARGYQLVFAEGDLTRNKDFVDDSGDMKGATKYFVKWGFRRIGKISTNDYIKKGDTAKIPA